jgi:hypothetical protein
MHRGIRGPLGDRGQGPGAGEHRGGGQGQDRHQRRSAACSGAASSTWARAAAMADDATEPWSSGGSWSTSDPEAEHVRHCRTRRRSEPFSFQAVYR